MKKLFFPILLFAIGFGTWGCENDDPSPTFSLDTIQSISFPGSSDSFVFTEATEEDSIQFATWTAASLSPDNLPDVTYRLEMDINGGSFDSPIILTTTKALSYKAKVLDINSKLVGETGLVGLDTTLDIALRVAGFIEGAEDGVETFYSNVVTTQATLYQAAPPDDPIIYLLGSATDAGWDNTLALPFTPLGDGVYEITTHLVTGNEWKIIQDLGAWAPQWGWDETGDSSSGGLSLRPDEATPDPMAIMAPDMTGSYKITVDIVNLTYTVVPDGEIWIVGPATPAAWDNTLVIPFSKIDDDGNYFIIIDLIGGEQWKILDELGMWAPQWGWDETGDENSGGLSFRPTEADPDPIPMNAPATDGLYRIDVNINDLTYMVTPQ